MACKILPKPLHYFSMPLSKLRSAQIASEELVIRVLTFDYFFIRKVLRKEFIFRHDDKILDIGSGTGILSIFFPKQHYIGIDIDPDLVDFASHHHAGYTFRSMDAGNLTFPPGSFTKALFVGAIHHIDDNTAQKMFVGLRKILQKGSMILAIEPIPSHWYNILGRLLRAHDRGHHILGYKDYLKRMSRYFTVKRSYKQPAGLIDYGVFVLKVT